MDVGKRLMEFRNEHDIARSALAKKSGVALSFINSIERGEKEPTIHTLRRLCNALGLTLSDFFASGQAPELPPEVRRVCGKIQQLPPEKLKVLESVLDTWVESD